MIIFLSFFIIIILFSFLFHKFKYYNESFTTIPNSSVSPISSIGPINVKDCIYKSIIICGLVKNSIKTIEKNINSLVKIGSFFNNYKIIIIENDSTDNTEIICKKMADENTNIIFKSYKLDHLYSIKNSFSKERFKKMAYVRNLYMDEIKNISWCPSDDCIILIADLDLYDLNPDVILNSIIKYQFYNWNVICANGIDRISCKSASWTKHKDIKNDFCSVEYEPDKFGHYYDSLATKFLDQSDYKFVDITNENSILQDHEKKTWTFIKSSKEEPLPVKSCFGGLAIYKSTILSNLQYDGEECEHITLHKDIDNIYILPEMLIYYT